MRKQPKVRSGKVLLLYEEKNGVKAALSGEQTEKGLLVELLRSGDLCDIPLPLHRFWIHVEAFVSIH